MEEADIGRRAEVLIVRMINRDKKFANIISLCLINKLKLKIQRPIKQAKKLGGKYKTDIILYDGSGNSVGLSLKTITTRDDDHLDRRWLDDWRNALVMPENVHKAFHEGIKRKAVNSRANLIFSNSEGLVKRFLSAKLDALLEEAFRKHESVLLLLGIVDAREERALYIFRLDDVIAFIKNNIQKRGITFGQRIRLGDYISIQRKAGNGKHIKIPKTDPRHPGNQIQIKLKPLALKNNAITHLDHCKVNFLLFTPGSSKQTKLPICY